jgi:hypothetical protein
MSLLRTYAILFIAGWALWLWMEKSGPAAVHPPPVAPYAGLPVPGQPGPGYPGLMPPGAPSAAPPGEGGVVADFQHGVDLLKAGYYRQAFLALWRSQSWVLAGVLTALVALLLPGLGRTVARWRGSVRPRSSLGPPGA